MLLYRAEINKSGIAGEGCFTLEAIKKGSVVGILAHDVDAISKEIYDVAQEGGDMHTIQTAMRWVGDIYLRNKPDLHKTEDKLNHSETPNLLYHCGVLFALRDIAAGEELTMHYKYVLGDNDVTAPTDVKTGKKVDILSGKQALLESAKELIKLLQE